MPRCAAADGIVARAAGISALSAMVWSLLPALPHPNGRFRRRLARHRQHSATPVLPLSPPEELVASVHTERYHIDRVERFQTLLWSGMLANPRPTSKGVRHALPAAANWWAVTSSSPGLFGLAAAACSNRPASPRFAALWLANAAAMSRHRLLKAFL